jgi:hypothetical protein
MKEYTSLMTLQNLRKTVLGQLLWRTTCRKLDNLYKADKFLEWQKPSKLTKVVWIL